MINQRQNDVLDGYLACQATSQIYAHPLLLALAQRLRRKDAFALTGPDAERNRAKRAVRAGMTVAAHKRAARKRETLFRADNVHNAMTAIGHENVRNREALGIGFQVGNLAGRQTVGRWSHSSNRVGTAWSATAIWAYGRRTPRSSAMRPAKA